jgi:hypothetical protein
MRQLEKSPIALGALLGAVFGALDILVTVVDPLAEDTPVALLTFYGPMFTTWGLAAFASTRRSGRVTHGGKVGGTVAFITFVVFWIANLVRINQFLNTMRHRADWQNLVARFQTSGFESFRAFANYDYLSGAPFKIFVAAAIGTVMGVIGGLCGVVFHRKSTNTGNRREWDGQ